jgi:outer membrane protein OmpA-like peptidoglycan-associated protein
MAIRKAHMLLVVGNRAIPDNIAEEETMSAIPTKSRIHALQYLPVSAALVLTLAAAPAVAQTQAPWVEMESTSVNLCIGGQSGEGVLRLPNLGTNCAYPFKLNGLGAGIHVGLSRISASGAVANMTRVTDLSGQYGAAEGEVTILAGGGAINMKNRANNVMVALKSETQGVGLGFGGQGMTIQVAEPPVNAPRSYVLEFGFNKTWVNQESRAMLDRVAEAWKCRYANIWLFGHTDTVGREDTNLELSNERAAAVREYLIGAGFNPSRIMLQPKGEDTQLVRTGNNVRMRTNRAVVVVVQEGPLVQN